MRKTIFATLAIIALLGGSLAFGELIIRDRGDERQFKTAANDASTFLIIRGSDGTVNPIGGSLRPIFNVSSDAATSASAITLTAAQTGTVVVLKTMTGTVGDAVYNLPTAAVGLTFTFVDDLATAAADLWFTAASGDTINGGTAAKSYKCTGDAVKQHVTIVATSASEWEIIAEDGTWANDNS